MKPCVKEIIVVEGSHDVSAVHAAVDGLVVATGGDRRKWLCDRWLPLAAHCGVCILTDPDGPGRRLRQALHEAMPGALDAELSPQQCRRGARVGVAWASPEAIRTALAEAGCRFVAPTDRPWRGGDLCAYGLAGAPEAAERRRQLAERLGLPLPSAKDLARALNALAIDAPTLLQLLSPEDEENRP